MTVPYYADARTQLYLGKMEEILPTLGMTFDACVTDPPYGETKLSWDHWPDGWPALVAGVTSAIWCFGSMRMFLDRAADFASADWKLSQDVVWEKHTGSGAAIDRFRRVHEHATHWYRGAWSDQYHATPRDAWHGADNARPLKRKAKPNQWGEMGGAAYEYTDTRLARSVIRVHSMHGRALHPTEKPAGILQPLIEYAVPPGGVLLDPFAGSGSTLATAKGIGRHAVGIEGDERYAEIIAKRLCQDPLDFETGAA